MTAMDGPARRRKRRKVSGESHSLPARNAVQRRFNQPCPRCGEKVQRIRYADNETTTARGARRAARYLPIAVSHGCWDPIGLARLMNSKL